MGSWAEVLGHHRRRREVIVDLVRRQHLSLLIHSRINANISDVKLKIGEAANETEKDIADAKSSKVP